MISIELLLRRLCRTTDQCTLSSPSPSCQVHQSDHCPKRPYGCHHYEKYAATFDDVTQNHWLVCPFFPLSCPNNSYCELVLQHQEVEHHVSQDCPLTLVLCMVGCKVRLTRKDMPSHISENLTEHVLLQQKMLISQQAKYHV